MMKQYKLGIEEKLVYRREMVIEIPEDMSEDELDRLLSKIEREYDHVQDIGYALDKRGIKIIERADDDTNSPFDSEFEIDEMDEVEENG